MKTIIGKDVQIGVKFPTGEPSTYLFGIRNSYVADAEVNLLEIGSTKEK